MNKKYKNLILLGFCYVFTVVVYFLFLKSSYFHIFESWVQRNFFLYFVTIVIIKILAIIWPPIPGGIFTLGSIPVLGWQYAYLADLVGNLTGSSIAYFLGKRYGENILQKFFDESTIAKIQRIKIKKHREIEAVFVLKAFMGSVVVEALSYGAGLLGIKFKNFFAGSILSHFVIALPFFYLVNNVVKGEYVYITIILFLAGAIILWEWRGRYLE